jgi:hypothetical protein
VPAPGRSAHPHRGRAPTDFGELGGEPGLGLELGLRGSGTQAVWLPLPGFLIFQLLVIYHRGDLCGEQVFGMVVR